MAGKGRKKDLKWFIDKVVVPYIKKMSPLDPDLQRGLGSGVVPKEIEAGLRQLAVGDLMDLSGDPRGALSRWVKPEAYILELIVETMGLEAVAAAINSGAFAQLMVEKAQDEAELGKCECITGFEPCCKG